MVFSQNQLGVTVLGSGSKGNAVLIHCGGDAILIDAGFSLKETRRRLAEAGMPEDMLRAIIVTHEHDDHVRGLRVCANHYKVPVYSTRQCADVLRRRDSKIGQLTLFAAGSPFTVSRFALEPFSIPHDANDPVGFIVRYGERKVGIATDMGHASAMVEYQLRACDTLMLESNHDLNLLAASTRPWSLKQRIMGRHGHLSNDATLELLKRVVAKNTRHVILAHMSQECNRLDLVERCGQQCLEHLQRSDIKMSVASQDRPLPTAWLECN
jgi:phosphoribosyl 1,2-cyclic phosphodiesterase